MSHITCAQGWRSSYPRVSLKSGARSLVTQLWTPHHTTSVRHIAARPRDRARPGHRGRTHLCDRPASPLPPVLRSHAMDRPSASSASPSSATSPALSAAVSPAASPAPATGPVSAPVVAVVGLGTMGTGIAEVLTLAGHEVIGIDVSDAAARRAAAGL